MTPGFRARHRAPVTAYDFGAPIGEDMMSRSYEPIDCGLHDRLEAWCVQRQRCIIRVATREGLDREIEARIEDVFAAGGEEFLLLDNGERIRLDRIAQIRASAPSSGG